MGYFLPLVISPFFYLAFNSIWQFAFFVVGLVVGALVLWLDFVMGYKYYSEPDKPVQLITRSPLFFLAYIPMSIFLLTSSGSSLGLGIIFGIGIVWLYELWQRRQYPDLLNSWFYAQASKPLTSTEFTWLFRGFAVFLVILAGLVYV